MLSKVGRYLPVASSTREYVRIVGYDSRQYSDELLLIHATPLMCEEACNERQITGPCYGFSAKGDVCWLKKRPFAPVPDSSCVSFFSLDRNDGCSRDQPSPSVMYVVLVPPERLLVAKEVFHTWLSGNARVVFLVFGTREWTQLVPFSWAEAMPKQHTFSLVGSRDIDQWRHLNALQLLLVEYPDEPWYAVLDVDTFFIRHNVDVMLGSGMYPDPFTVSYLFGLQRTWMPEGSNEVFDAIDTESGVILSNSALRTAAAHVAGQCEKECEAFINSGVRFACCMKLAGIQAIGQEGFWNEMPDEALAAQRDVLSPFPISFYGAHDSKTISEMHQMIQSIEEDPCDPNEQMRIAQAGKNVTIRCKFLVAGSRREAVPLYWDSIKNYIDGGTHRSIRFSRNHQKTVLDSTQSRDASLKMKK